MVRMSWWVAGAVALTAGVAGSACKREAETGSVTTRTEGSATTAPSAAPAARSDRALVRVVNAIPGGALDLYAGDSAAFSKVPYRKVTPFQPVAAEAASFQIKSGPEAKPVAENREPLAPGAHYTVIAMPDEGGASRRNLRVLHDDFAPVPGDKARLRLVNAIPGEDDLTLKLRGFDDELFSDVAFKREAGWKDVDPFVGTLVLLNGKERTVATLPEMKVAGGKSYTLVAAGRPAKAEVILVEDDVKAPAE